jgi:hypothetical protein
LFCSKPWFFKKITAKEKIKGEASLFIESKLLNYKKSILYLSVLALVLEVPRYRGRPP